MEKKPFLVLVCNQLQWHAWKGSQLQESTQGKEGLKPLKTALPLEKNVILKDVIKSEYLTYGVSNTMIQLKTFKVGR